MAQNIAMIPQSKDYKVVNGSPVKSDSILDSAYFAITIPNGRWMYGQPGQGSLVYTLANKLRSSSIEQQYASMVDSAITTQLVNTGQATEVDTENTQATPTGTANTTNITQAATSTSGQLGFVGV